MVMDLRQLEYFVAVAEEANFTRAAARVHISQSGVSAQLRRLEEELGAPLIERNGRTSSLTTAGEAALGPARAALAAAEQVRAAVDDVNGLLRGRLVVGMVVACTVAPLFEALAAFHAAHPGVEVTLLEDTSDRLLAQVRDGGADLALVGTAGPPPADLHALPIVSEGLVALVPPTHPLAGRRGVTARLLSTHPVVTLPGGTGIRAAFDRWCAGSGAAPDVALQASAPDTVADLAARGMGVGVLSASMAAADDRRLRAVPLNGVRTPAVLSLVWAGEDRSPALASFLERARSAFGVGAR